MIDPQISDYAIPTRQPFDLTGKSETEDALAWMLSKDIRNGYWGTHAIHDGGALLLERQGFVEGQTGAWALTMKAKLALYNYYPAAPVSS
jgi:hypothetical protein